MSEEDWRATPIAVRVVVMELLQRVAPYVEAGVTRWLQYLTPWRSSLVEARERIRKGSPRV